MSRELGIIFNLPNKSVLERVLACEGKRDTLSISPNFAYSARLSGFDGSEVSLALVAQPRRDKNQRPRGRRYVIGFLGGVRLKICVGQRVGFRVNSSMLARERRYFRDNPLYPGYSLYLISPVISEKEFCERERVLPSYSQFCRVPIFSQKNKSSG